MEDNVVPTPEEPKDDFMKASADEWSDMPTPPAPPTPEPTDRWGSPEATSAEDASRWQGEIYSPESESEETFKDVVIDMPTSGGAVPPASVPLGEKKKFPVWAIILIVVLVLCICVACPIAVILGGGAAFLDNFSLVLPFLV